ncbi:hypothetical protein GCM10023238_17800 [Streptomyces heliomycini]
MRTGIERLNGGFEPYPALVVDAMYDVVAANRGSWRCFDGVPGFAADAAAERGALTLPPAGAGAADPEPAGVARPSAGTDAAAHRPATARSGCGRVRRGGGVPRADTAGRQEEPAEPVAYFALPMLIEHRGRTLSFVSSISTSTRPWT